jgi:hypothetical protein
MFERRDADNALVTSSACRNWSWNRSWNRSWNLFISIRVEIHSYNSEGRGESFNVLGVQDRIGATVIVSIWDLIRVVGEMRWVVLVVGDCLEKGVTSPQAADDAVHGDHQQEGTEDLEQGEVYVLHLAILFPSSALSPFFLAFLLPSSFLLPSPFFLDLGAILQEPVSER